jgi:hypothetical protein
MKLSRITCFVAVSFALLRNVSGQAFVNLDFEDATVTIAHESPYYALESDAIPGWSASPLWGLSGGLYIGYGTISLGGAVVFLEDGNVPSGYGPLPIQGSFSVLLDYQSASIWQTGTIPNTAQSLTFFSVQDGLQVTFAGQNIPFSAIGNGVNAENGASYTIYGADISSYAGETGQLLFTVPGQTTALLDNIQFSSSSVPEPNVFGLFALGGLLLIFRRSN